MNWIFKKETPENCGISSKNVLNFIEAISKGDNNQETHSFLMIRHGKLVFEGYFAPYNQDTAHSLFSVSKAFACTAIGYLVNDKKISVDDYVYEYFPELIEDDINIDNKKIKIKDLLSMSFGQDGGGVHESQKKNQKSDVMLYDFFYRKKDLECGERFRYDSYGTYMLSAIINKVTGENIVDFLMPRLFTPLGIEKPYFIKDELNISVGWTGMRLTLRDLAKVGYTYLNNGVYDGKQIIPSDWIQEATKVHISTKGCPTGLDWQEGYCYQFWKGRYNTTRFCGAFGQMCVIMPDYDAIFVVNSGYDNDKLSYILECFYDNIMFNINDSAIPENKEEYLKLEKALNNLSLVYNYSSISPLAQFIDGKIYELSSSSKYKSVQFSFDTDTVTTTLYSEKGNYTFKAGFNKPVWGKAHGTEFAALEVTDFSDTVSTACWTDKNQLEITVRLFGTPTILKLKGKFERQNTKIDLFTIRGREV